jgi:ornithine cyclodeaminase/alanine dehydrogenase-like protein (mu-crystallin family)
MALLLHEEDVRLLLDMKGTILVMEQAFLALAEGNAVNRPRQRIAQPNGVLHLLAASISTMGVMGYKAYTVFRTGMRFAIVLFDALDGNLLALIEADWLSSMRTGATSAVATRHLARPDSTRIGLIGAGQQATTQLLGICEVLPITQVSVYSRRLPECEMFCSKMARGLNILVQPAASPREAIEEADIVITATTSPDPVFPGDWLKPGCHINAIGSNWANRHEIDLPTLQRSDIIVTDSREQALVEAGDLIIPANLGQFDWNRVSELADVVAGRGPLRQSPGETTLYKALGIALEDIAAAGLVYRLARERGVGEEIQLFQ